MITTTKMMPPTTNTGTYTEPSSDARGAATTADRSGDGEPVV